MSIWIVYSSSLDLDVGVEGPEDGGGLFSKTVLRKTRIACFVQLARVTLFLLVVPRCRSRRAPGRDWSPLAAVLVERSQEAPSLDAD